MTENIQTGRKRVQRRLKMDKVVSLQDDNDSNKRKISCDVSKSSNDISFDEGAKTSKSILKNSKCAFLTFVIYAKDYRLRMLKQGTDTESDEGDKFDKQEVEDITIPQKEENENKADSSSLKKKFQKKIPKITRKAVKKTLNSNSDNKIRVSVGMEESDES